MRCRAASPDGAGEIARLFDFCCPDILVTVVVRRWLACHISDLGIEMQKTLLKSVIDLSKNYRSCATDLDIFELIASSDIPEASIAIEFLKNKLGESRILDRLTALLLDHQ
ncbi:unnamed protein product, partial [Brugia timori]|uniref:Uncharacterized protein n=1 Tax=Brugia timori TaxID=42155 RepID=A0A0R3QI90_9BILA